MAAAKEDGVHDHATEFSNIYEGMLAAAEKNHINVLRQVNMMILNFARIYVSKRIIKYFYE